MISHKNNIQTLYLIVKGTNAMMNTSYNAETASSELFEFTKHTVRELVSDLMNEYPFANMKPVINGTGIERTYEALNILNMVLNADDDKVHISYTQLAMEARSGLMNYIIDITNGDDPMKSLHERPLFVKYHDLMEELPTH